MSPTGLPGKTAAGLVIPSPHDQSVTVVVVSGDPVRYRMQCTYPGCPAPFGRVQNSEQEAEDDVTKHLRWLKGKQSV